MFLSHFVVFLVLSLLSLQSDGRTLEVRRAPGQRIIGGAIARAGQFPYAAAIYVDTVDGRFFCMGTLLNNQWVLTAAHCVLGATLATIQIGSNKLAGNDPNRVILSTDDITINPDYNDDTLENDVALIKLRMAVKLSLYVQPIASLARSDVIGEGSEVVAIGWGQTSDENEGLSNDLLYVTLSAVSNELCRYTFGDFLSENMMCAAGNNNEGTCYGDIGGPLLQFIRGSYAYHVGISSFLSGSGCESTHPSGYTKTYPYVGWISSITGISV